MEYKKNLHDYSSFLRASPTGENFQKVLDHKLNYIKEDSGYDDESFDKDYKTLCPITLTDLIALELTLISEMDRVEEWHIEQKTPISMDHVRESIFHHLSLFVKALEDRRDKFKGVLDPREKNKK